MGGIGAPLLSNDYLAAKQTATVPSRRKAVQEHSQMEYDTPASTTMSSREIARLGQFLFEFHIVLYSFKRSIFEVGEGRMMQSIVAQRKGTTGVDIVVVDARVRPRPI